MKALEWPGIATVVGLALIGAIIFDLEKWQPLMAALIALGGGSLAYRGAMEKLRQDAEQNGRELLRRQLSSYLKLDLAARRLQPIAEEIDARLISSDDGSIIPVTSIKIEEPPEIEEAWDNLDVFPRKLIREIAAIREHIRRVDDLLSEVTSGKLIASEQTGETRLNLIHQSVNAVSDACSIILDVLAPEIDRLAPNLPEFERMVTLYGEPNSAD